MKLTGNSSKWLYIIGLVFVWVSVSSIFGFITYISLFLLLLSFQVILTFTIDIMVKVKQKVFVSGLLAITGIAGFIIALFIEVPLWFKIFILIAQGAFIYAEIKMIIEARLIKKT